MKKNFIFPLLLVFFLCNVSAEDMSVSFESYDMPGWFIGVENDEAILIALNTKIDRENTTFTIVPGLANEACLSIQSAIDTNYYLRHQNKVIKLHEYSTWMIYKKDATYKVEHGLADKSNPNYISFRSWNYPEFVIRHKNGKLYIDESDGSDLFNNNATFIIKTPNWDGKSRMSKNRIGEKSFAGSRNASFASFIFTIALVITAVVFVIINLRKKGESA